MLVYTNNLVIKKKKIFAIIIELDKPKAINPQIDQNVPLFLITSLVLNILTIYRTLDTDLSKHNKLKSA